MTHRNEMIMCSSQEVKACRGGHIYK